MRIRLKAFVTLLMVSLVVAGTVPTLAVGASSSVQSAAAQQVTDCTTIDTPGRYVLAGDIVRDEPPDQQTTCIDITSSDVVFDGNGSEMSGNITTKDPWEGSVTGGVAIRATGVSNVTIRNVELRSWKYGVRFENVTDSDVQIRGFDYAGPSAVDSENITLHDSLLRSATVDFDADHVMLRRNDIDADPNGDYYTDAVHIEGADAVLVNNDIDPGPTSNTGADSIGLTLSGDGSRIQDNRFRERPTRQDPDPRLSESGFIIRGNNTTVSGNTFRVSNLRTSSLGGDDNVFTDNNLGVEDTRFGLSVGGKGNTVSESEFHGQLSVSGSDNVVTNVSIPESSGVDSIRISGSDNIATNVSAPQASVSGTNSTLSDSRISLIFARANSTVVRNTGDDIVGESSVTIIDSEISGTVSGSSGSVIRSNEMSELRLSGTDITIRNNTIRERLHLEGAENLTLQNGSVPTIELVDSRNNSISGYTAENITLRSISDNNTITQSTADRIQVVDDARNNTVRNNDAAVRVAGETSFDNRIVDNDASGADTGIELDRARRTLVLNNTVSDNGRGIVLDGASDNRLRNNTATGNSGPAYRSSNGSVNNTVTNLTLGPTVSFRSRDVALDVEPSPPDSPAGLTDVGVFLEATNTSADSWLNLTAHYAESDTAYVEEGSLRLWRFDESWAEVPGFNRVDTAENVVEANVSGDAFGVLAPLGNATDTTPPTISDYDVRTPDDATLVVEFNASEPLSEVRAVVTNASGAEVARLNGSDFTESGAGPYTYTGSVALPNGTYTATLETAADAVGNDGASGQSDTVTIGATAVPLSMSANRTTVDPGEAVEFTVTRADTDDPVNATVHIDDRSVVTGENGRVNVSFPDAGTFEVTATKADTATERFRNDTVEVTVRSPTAGRARIAVDPASETVAAGESFRVAVAYNATAADEVYGVQFTLEYDTSLLNATNVTKGPYLGPEADTLVVNSSIDDDAGRVRYGESRRADGGVSGDGTLAYVEFTATDRLDTASVRTNLSFTEIKASDPDGRRIETDSENGSVRIERNRPPALSAALSFAVNNVGSPVRVGVDATDDTAVLDVRLLAPDGAATDTLSCGTPACNGTVSDTPTTSSWNDSAGAYDRVSYRVVATDDQGANTTETLQTAVYIPGDASGDGLVDIVDAVGVGRSWTCTVGDPCYSAAGDLNNDGVVDIFDAVVIGRNWQETAGA